MRLLVIALCLVSCSAQTERDREVTRVRAHLTTVYRELQSTPMTPARERVLADLERYIEAEQYPTNETSIASTPIFIDDDGARCAMAALIEASGEPELVQRIARDHKYAYIRELAGDAELVRWLAAHDLTLDEAARIQPSYENRIVHGYQPTASLVLSGGTGWVDDEPALFGGIGVRLGVRRGTSTVGDCDRCVDRSSALVAEYQRVGGDGGIHQLGLTFSSELKQQGYDHQWYLLGGALLALDRNDDPGTGFGGQLGFGFSVRRRKVPFFVEGIASGLALDTGPSVRLRADIGVVW